MEVVDGGRLLSVEDLRRKRAALLTRSGSVAATQSDSRAVSRESMGSQATVDQRPTMRASVGQGSSSSKSLRTSQTAKAWPRAAMTREM